MSEVSYPRNTSVWAFDRLRSDAIPHLLDDLRGCHLEGIPEELCMKIRAMHQGLLDLAATIPDDKLLRGSILESLQKYADCYVAWNDIRGNEPHHRTERDAAVRKIRDARQTLAATIRQNNYAISENIDLKQVDAMYAALEGLTKSAPRVFIRLGQAVARYLFRRKQG
jgi:hypothetical protein